MHEPYQLKADLADLEKRKINMKQIFKLEDFNGVDGGTLTLHTDGENHLLMITDEKSDEHASVYITKEHLKKMIDLLG